MKRVLRNTSHQTIVHLHNEDAFQKIFWFLNILREIINIYETKILYTRI